MKHSVAKSADFLSNNETIYQGIKGDALPGFLAIKMMNGSLVLFERKKGGKGKLKKCGKLF